MELKTKTCFAVYIAILLTIVKVILHRARLVLTVMGSRFLCNAALNSLIPLILKEWVFNIQERNERPYEPRNGK